MGNRAITEPLALTTDYVSIDGRYTDANGNPYASVAAAETALGRRMNQYTVGLTVLVKESGWNEAKEYWVQPKGTTPETYGLVPKSVNLTTKTELSKEEKYYASANVSDRSAVVVAETGIVKSLGYRVLNPNLSFVEQVTDANTVYEIRDEFNLEGINVTEVEKQCTVSTDISSTSTPNIYYIDNTPIVIETGKGVWLPVGCVLLNSGKTAVSYSTINTIYLTNGTYYVASKTSGTYTINLYEDIVTIPSNCTLKFNGGKLKNGILGGNSTKLDGDIRFGEDVVIAGTYEKKNSLTTSIFDGDYDGVDLIKNIDLLANNLELLDGETINIDKVGTTIQLNSIYSMGYATINFKFKTEKVSGLEINNKDGFTLKNINVTEDYPSTSSKPITLGCAFVIDLGASNKTYDLVVENCNFRGRYNSSCLAASNIKSCLIKNCTWTDVIANDHYIYCSTKIKNYTIENCVINGGFSFGAFKVREASELGFNCDSLNVSGHLNYIFVFTGLSKSNIYIQNSNCDTSTVDKSESLFANLDYVSGVSIKIANSLIKLNSNATHTLFNPGTGSSLLSIEVVSSTIVGEICGCGDIVITNSHLTKTSDSIILQTNSIKIDGCEIHIADTDNRYNSVFRFYNTPTLLDIKNSKFYTIYNVGDNKTDAPAGFIKGNSLNTLNISIENTYVEKLGRSLVINYTGDVNLYLKDNDITTGTIYDPLFDTFTGTWLNRSYGISTNRPTLNSKNIANVIGYPYYDTTLKKPIYWNGTAWVDANGGYIVDNSGTLQNRLALTSPVKGQQFKLTGGANDVYLIYGSCGWLKATDGTPWFDDSGTLNAMYDKYNYALLTEEPSDWATKYNTYYKKVNGVYTLLTTAETWAADTYYKKDESAYKGIQVKLTDTDVELRNKVVKWDGTKYINIVDNVALKAGTPKVTFTTENNTTTATITSTSGGKIYYTKDGNDPTSSSTEYSSAITLADGDQVKAICIRDHIDNSAPGYVPVSVPVITFSNAGILTITCETPNAKVYYTIDGNAPTTSSTEYDSSASVTIAKNVTVKAFAVLIGRVNSDVASKKRS